MHWLRVGALAAGPLMTPRRVPLPAGDPDPQPRPRRVRGPGPGRHLCRSRAGAGAAALTERQRVASCSVFGSLATAGGRRSFCGLRVHYGAEPSGTRPSLSGPSGCGVVRWPSSLARRCRHSSTRAAADHCGLRPCVSGPGVTLPRPLSRRSRSSRVAGRCARGRRRRLVVLGPAIRESPRSRERPGTVGPHRVVSARGWRGPRASRSIVGGAVPWVPGERCRGDESTSPRRQTGPRSLSLSLRPPRLGLDVGDAPPRPRSVVTNSRNGTLTRISEARTGRSVYHLLPGLLKAWASAGGDLVVVPRSNPAAQPLVRSTRRLIDSGRSD